MHVNYILQKDGLPLLVLKNRETLIADNDLWITWTATIWTYGTSHTFLEIIIDAKKKRKVFIPICLLNPKTKLIAKSLIETTKNSHDGRFGSKNGEFYFSTDLVRVFKISLDLLPLASNYVSLEMIPNGFWEHLRSPHCPFCTEVFSQHSGD